MLLIIGSGRMATHFSRYFHLLKIPFQNWNRKDHSEADLKKKLSQTSRVLLLISDKALADFTAKNLSEFSGPIFHMSGALEIPGTISLHPLMTFASELYEFSFYQQIPFVLLCGHRLQDFFPEMPNPSFEIQAEFKSKYHALCVFSGNFTTLLWQEAFKGFAKLGLPKEIAFLYLKKTAENLMSPSVDANLTGPLARKDQPTVTANLQSIAGEPSENIYRAFVKTYFSEYPL